MRFLVRLSNRSEFAPTDAKELTLRSYKLVKEFGGDVGNLRVSSSAVELDLLLESKDNLQQATKALEKEFGSLLTLRELDITRPQTDPNASIREGLQLFNEERFWESHEALESVWLSASGADKEILQGLILLAAALVHLQKNELAVTLSVMGRAQSKLSHHHSEHFGVNIDDLRDHLSRMMSAGHPDYLKIKFVN